MRPRTACTTCRRRQRRCIVKEASSACVYCTQRNLPCSLSEHPTDDTSPRSNQNLSPTVSNAPAWRPRASGFDFAAPDRSLELPPHDVLQEIASAYFTYIHEPSHHLFHKPSFMADLASAQLPRSILLCAIALAARFSTSAYFHGIEPRLRGDIYAKEAGRNLDLGDLSLTTVHIAIMLGAFYGADGDFMHENLYYTIGCRLGGLLHVPDLATTSPLERELHIRLFWTLEMIDVWSSNAAKLPRLLPTRNDIPYPLGDTLFLQMSRSDNHHDLTSMVSLQLSTSLLAEKIKLNSILAEIALLNRASADRRLSSYGLHAETENLAAKLNDWRQQLPLSLTNTPENLAKHAISGEGGSFVALYLGYYHFAQLLYYRYLHLPNLPDGVTSPGTQEVKSFAAQCHVNATALCETLYSAYATPGAEVYYSMVGHVLVIASTVQLHILLFSDNELQVSAARQRLERNFGILCMLQNLWRTLDISFGRFREFHNACMKVKEDASNASSAFRLDKWMVEFLFQFSQPVEERPEEVITTTDSFGEYGDDVALGEDETGFDLRQWSWDALGIDVPQDINDTGPRTSAHANEN